MDTAPYIRPATPQAVLHRAPDKPDADDTLPSKPNKYIILLLASTSVAGKVQIALSVSEALSCALYQGDSLHESSAKAATVGANNSEYGGRKRYQRMWLSKMTRTGLLFPEESRPANEGFSGFGGGSSPIPTSRRGSGSSISSTLSLGSDSAVGPTRVSNANLGSQFMTSGKLGTNQYVNQPVFTVSEEERRRKSNPALVVLTHPELEQWHRDAIRETTGEYGIGVIFVPFTQSDTEHDDQWGKDEEEPLPVLKPLDPRTIIGFSSFDALKAAVDRPAGGEKLTYGKGKKGNLEEEMLLSIHLPGSVEEIIEEIVKGVRDVMLI